MIKQPATSIVISFLSQILSVYHGKQGVDSLSVYFFPFFLGVDLNSYEINICKSCVNMINIRCSAF